MKTPPDSLLDQDNLRDPASIPIRKKASAAKANLAFIRSKRPEESLRVRRNQRSEYSTSENHTKEEKEDED